MKLTWDDIKTELTEGTLGSILALVLCFSPLIIAGIMFLVSKNSPPPDPEPTPVYTRKWLSVDMAQVFVGKSVGEFCATYKDYSGIKILDPLETDYRRCDETGKGLYLDHLVVVDARYNRRFDDPLWDEDKVNCTKGKDPNDMCQYTNQIFIDAAMEQDAKLILEERHERAKAMEPQR